MTRVLHVLRAFEPGGAERMAVHLMRESAAAGYDVRVASLFGPVGSDLEDLVEGVVDVRHLHKRPGFDPRMFPRLRRTFREFRPDVYHTHTTTLKYAFPVQVVTRIGAGVHTVQNIAEKEVEGVAKLVHRAAFKMGVQPVAVAAEVAASLERVYGIDRAPVLPNAVPINAYRGGDGGAWRAQNGFRDEVLVTCVARLRPQKNHDLLLRTFARLVPRFDSVRLLLVGDGDLRADLESLAAALGIADRVHFLGARTDVPDVLAAADVFVMASDWEGNPLAVMEAMAAGKAVVATAVGGTPELIEPGVNGFLIPPRDAAGLEAALQRLVEDPELRGKVGSAAARRADDFDVAHVAAQYHELYEKLVSRTAQR